MPDIQFMRNYVSNLYGGPLKWQERVARMDDDQVIAIYFRKIEEPKRPEPQTPEPTVEPLFSYIPPPIRGPHANEDDFPIY